MPGFHSKPPQASSTPRRAPTSTLAPSRSKCAVHNDQVANAGLGDDLDAAIEDALEERSRESRAEDADVVTVTLLREPFGHLAAQDDLCALIHRQ